MDFGNFSTNTSEAYTIDDSVNTTTANATTPSSPPPPPFTTLPPDVEALNKTATGHLSASLSATSVSLSTSAISASLSLLRSSPTLSATHLTATSSHSASSYPMRVYPAASIESRDDTGGPTLFFIFYIFLAILIVALIVAAAMYAYSQTGYFALYGEVVRRMVMTPEAYEKRRREREEERLKERARMEAEWSQRLLAGGDEGDAAVLGEGKGGINTTSASHRREMSRLFFEGNTLLRGGASHDDDDGDRSQRPPPKLYSAYPYFNSYTPLPLPTTLAKGSTAADPTNHALEVGSGGADKDDALMSCAIVDRGGAVEAATDNGRPRQKQQNGNEEEAGEEECVEMKPMMVVPTAEQNLIDVDSRDAQHSLGDKANDRHPTGSGEAAPTRCVDSYIEDDDDGDDDDHNVTRHAVEMTSLSPADHAVGSLPPHTAAVVIEATDGRPEEEPMGGVVVVRPLSPSKGFDGDRHSPVVVSPSASPLLRNQLGAHRLHHCEDISAPAKDQFNEDDEEEDTAAQQHSTAVPKPNDFSSSPIVGRGGGGASSASPASPASPRTAFMNASTLNASRYTEEDDDEEDAGKHFVVSEHRPASDTVVTDAFIISSRPARAGFATSTSSYLAPSFFSPPRLHHAVGGSRTDVFADNKGNGGDEDDFDPYTTEREVADAHVYTPSKLGAKPSFAEDMGNDETIGGNRPIDTKLQSSPYSRVNPSPNAAPQTLINTAGTLASVNTKRDIAVAGSGRGTGVRRQTLGSSAQPSLPTAVSLRAAQRKKGEEQNIRVIRPDDV